MRLIDADELLKKAHDIVFKYPDGVEYRHRCVDPYDIVTAPTVEITETEIQEALNKRCMTAVANEYLIAILGKRPQGEWINREAVSNTTFPFWERYECNQCHKFNGYSNFCPNCGADMRGENTDS